MDTKLDEALDEYGDPVHPQSSVPKKKSPRQLYCWTIDELNDIIDKFNRGDVPTKEED